MALNSLFCALISLIQNATLTHFDTLYDICMNTGVVYFQNLCNKFCLTISVFTKQIHVLSRWNSLI